MTHDPLLSRQGSGGSKAGDGRDEREKHVLTEPVDDNGRVHAWPGSPHASHERKGCRHRAGERKAWKSHLCKTPSNKGQPFRPEPRRRRPKKKTFSLGFTIAAQSCPRRKHDRHGLWTAVLPDPLTVNGVFFRRRPPSPRKPAEGRGRKTLPGRPTFRPWSPLTSTECGRCQNADANELTSTVINHSEISGRLIAPE